MNELITGGAHVQLGEEVGECEAHPLAVAAVGAQPEPSGPGHQYSVITSTTEVVVVIRRRPT